MRRARFIGFKCPISIHISMSFVKKSLKVSKCCMTSGLVGDKIRIFDPLYFSMYFTAAKIAMIVFPSAVGKTTSELIPKHDFVSST